MKRRLSIRKAQDRRGRTTKTPGVFDVVVRQPKQEGENLNVYDLKFGSISPRRPRKDGTGGVQGRVFGGNLFSRSYARAGTYRFDSEDQARQFFKDLFKGGEL